MQDIWDEEIAARYDTPGTGMFSPDVLGPTIDRLAELAGAGRALEFAIGTGRVAVPLCERGVPVSGIELSPAMVAQLRTKADETTIPVILGDMAAATAPGNYSLVYLVFNTISNLLTQAAQVECFRNAARHLVPGGRFVIELWVPELRKLTPGSDFAVAQPEPGHFCLDAYDVISQHVVSHHFLFGDGRRARLHRTSHRYIGLQSWTSWHRSLDLNLRAGMATGFEQSSPPSRVHTSQSIVSRNASDVSAGLDRFAALLVLSHERR